MPGGAPVAVISHGLWQRRFGGDTAVVNRRVKINGQPFTIALSSILFGVPARDPITIGGAVLLLALCSAAACVVPARCAMRVDPVRALKYE